MPIEDYDQLVAAILRYTDDESLEENLPLCVDLAEDRIAQELRLPAQEEQSLLGGYAANQRAIYVPEHVTRVKHLILNRTPISEVEMVSRSKVEERRQNGTGFSYATHMVLEGNRLELGPIPSAACRFTLVYECPVPRLSEVGSRNLIINGDFLNAASGAMDLTETLGDQGWLATNSGGGPWTISSYQAHYLVGTQTADALLEAQSYVSYLEAGEIGSLDFTLNARYSGNVPNSDVVGVGFYVYGREGQYVGSVVSATPFTLTNSFADYTDTIALTAQQLRSLQDGGYLRPFIQIDYDAGADAATQFEFEEVRAVNPNPTNAILKNYENLLLYASLVEAAVFDDDVDANKWEGLYERAKKSIRLQAWNRRFPRGARQTPSTVV
jgi:hypothetical protein